jgi:hypothetical protein
MKEIYYWLSLIYLIPLTLLCGFAISCFLESILYTPLFEKYGYPLRNNFWTGCEMYFYVEQTKDCKCDMVQDWYPCTSYKNYQKEGNINYNIKD